MVSVFALRCAAEFRYVFAVLQSVIISTVTAITVATVVVGSACVCLFFDFIAHSK